VPRRGHRGRAARYCGARHPADLATYIQDMPDKLAWSHLVIARAGASTIAELTARAARHPDPASVRHRRPPDRNAREMAKPAARG
jgi:hypothetical protein